MGHFRHLRFVSYSVFALCWILRFRPRIKALRLPNAANLLVSAEEQHKLLVLGSAKPGSENLCASPRNTKKNMTQVKQCVSDSCDFSFV